MIFFLSKLNYKFNTTPFKILPDVFVESDKMILLEIYMEMQRNYTI